MIVQAINNTAGTLTYSSEGITILSGATVTISNTLLIAFAQDPNVISDIDLDYLSISDTIKIYNGDAAVKFLTDSALLYYQSGASTVRDAILNQTDLVTTFTWLDFGLSTERISVIVYSSSSLGLTATKTMVYTLSSGYYRLDTITWT